MILLNTIRDQEQSKQFTDKTRGNGAEAGGGLLVRETQKGARLVLAKLQKLER